MTFLGQCRSNKVNIIPPLRSSKAVAQAGTIKFEPSYIWAAAIKKPLRQIRMNPVYLLALYLVIGATGYNPVGWFCKVTVQASTGFQRYSWSRYTMVKTQFRSHKPHRSHPRASHGELILHRGRSTCRMTIRNQRLHTNRVSCWFVKYSIKIKEN